MGDEILHSAGRIVDIEFCVVLKERVRDIEGRETMLCRIRAERSWLWSPWCE